MALAEKRDKRFFFDDPKIQPSSIPDNTDTSVKSSTPPSRPHPLENPAGGKKTNLDSFNALWEDRDKK